MSEEVPSRTLAKIIPSEKDIRKRKT